MLFRHSFQAGYCAQSRFVHPYTWASIFTVTRFVHFFSRFLYKIERDLQQWIHPAVPDIWIKTVNPFQQILHGVGWGYWTDSDLTCDNCQLHLADFDMRDKKVVTLAKYAESGAMLYLRQHSLSTLATYAKTEEIQYCCHLNESQLPFYDW